MSSPSYSANIHRLSPGDMWIPDNRGGSLIVNDLAKQQANLPTSNMFNNMSQHSSTTSSCNSSIASMNDQRKSSDASISYPSSITSIAKPTTTAAPKRHRADTASLKEYGECYRRLGQGTSAVVMVVRKLGEDGRSEKLYAIKQFRKKQKQESEKEYMKKLTSEFCISSTFTHPNVVETIDLVLDSKKRYCTVMEYVKSIFLFCLFVCT